MQRFVSVTSAGIHFNPSVSNFPVGFDQAGKKNAPSGGTKRINFRVCANYVEICSRQKMMAHFSFHDKISSRGTQTKKKRFPGSIVEVAAAKFLNHQGCPRGNSGFNWIQLKVLVFIP